MTSLEKYKVDVPAGECGSAKVDRMVVSEEDQSLGQLRALFGGGRGRYVPAGEYTRLSVHGETMMTDTPDEIRDHLEAIRRAEGHCLINGLGLGLVVNGMLMSDQVEKVTVVEVNPDVIALVAPYWEEKWGGRLHVVEADAFEWVPPKGLRYGVVWHDVWTHLCVDNLPQMHKLHRRYGRRCEWQGSWGRGICEAQRDREKHADRLGGFFT